MQGRLIRHRRGRWQAVFDLTIYLHPGHHRLEAAEISSVAITLPVVSSRGGMHVIAASSDSGLREFRQCIRELAHVVVHQRRSMFLQKSPVPSAAMATT
jgi:hypothetical protein